MVKLLFRNSQYIKNLKVSKNELKNIKKAKLSSLVRNKMYGVIYSLQFEKSLLKSEL
jgi:hypothetical protein